MHSLHCWRTICWLCMCTKVILKERKIVGLRSVPDIAGSIIKFSLSSVWIFSFENTCPTLYVCRLSIPDNKPVSSSVKMTTFINFSWCCCFGVELCYQLMPSIFVNITTVHRTHGLGTRTKVCGQTNKSNLVQANVKLPSTVQRHVTNLQFLTSSLL